MTAAELIIELQKLDPNEIIYLRDTGCGCCSYGVNESDRIVPMIEGVYFEGNNQRVEVKVLV